MFSERHRADLLTHNLSSHVIFTVALHWPSAKNGSIWYFLTFLTESM